MISTLRIKDNLPFISLKIWHENKSLELNNVLVDTGSASSIRQRTPAYRSGGLKKKFF